MCQKLRKFSKAKDSGGSEVQKLEQLPELEVSVLRDRTGNEFVE
jgi:hypothetical protein